MSDDNTPGCLLLIFIAIFVAGLALGGHWTATEERTLAVQAGVGRWVTDSTGHAAFVYGEVR